VSVQTTSALGRKSPSAADLKIWREYIETSRRLGSMLASRLQTQTDLSMADYAVLLALTEARGNTVRSSELAELIDWERSRLSHHLGRMESRGLVVRLKCVNDSRGAEIALTPEGSAQFRRASSSHLRAVQELFVDALSPELLAKVDEVNRALRTHLDPLPG
jgi:DNA-binding MarR family transcriptional regulator